MYFRLKDLNKLGKKLISRKLNTVCIHSKRKISSLDFKDLEIQMKNNKYKNAINTSKPFIHLSILLFSLNSLYPLFLLTEREWVSRRFK